MFGKNIILKPQFIENIFRCSGNFRTPCIYIFSSALFTLSSKSVSIKVYFLRVIYLTILHTNVILRTLYIQSGLGLNRLYFMTRAVRSFLAEGESTYVSAQPWAFRSADSTFRFTHLHHLMRCPWLDLLVRAILDVHTCLATEIVFLK